MNTMLQGVIFVSFLVHNKLVPKMIAVILEVILWLNKLCKELDEIHKVNKIVWCQLLICSPYILKFFWLDSAHLKGVFFIHTDD